MSGNRYANDWNEYSRKWEGEFGERYAHLGDEWNDDSTVDRKRDEFYFGIFGNRFLQAGMTVLEVGPGGGKWTVRLAPKVGQIIVIDTADEMLERTRKRCESLGIKNVDYILSNGKNFQPVPDESIDFVFSYDVFVHILLEDTWPYTQEFARVLVPGGQGVCHYAVNTVPEAWDRIEQNNEWYRHGKNSLGQFYYFSPEALRRMYERCGLIIGEEHQEGLHHVCIFKKPAASVIPRLEELLKRLMTEEANDDSYRNQIIADLTSLPTALEQALAPLLNAAQSETDYHKRVRYGAEIRRIWRGL